MERISVSQLLLTTLLFQIGSTVIFGFASSAGRDAWIVALISMLFGALLVSMYIWTFRLNSNRTLVECLKVQFGKWLGTPLAWLYPLAFLYDASRDLRDFSDFIKTVVLPHTNQWIVMILFITVVMYALYHGIETLVRVVEFIFPVIFLMSVTQVFLLISSNMMDLGRLLPFVEHGWGLLWKTIWPLNVTVPYGETIVFMMIWSVVANQERIFKFTLFSTVCYGLLMAFGDILAVSILGEPIFKSALYPMHLLLRQISVGTFIQNLDAIVVLQAIFVGFVKVSILIYGSTVGIQQLTGIINRRLLIIPLSLCVVILSVYIASNVEEHMRIGLKIVPNLVWVPLFVLLPIVLMLVTIIRKKWAT